MSPRHSGHRIETKAKETRGVDEADQLRSARDEVR
jgi:hypothetical protein